MDETIVNAMVDIETLGLGQDAIILSLGAVVFSKHQGSIKSFYREISISNQESLGRTRDPSTEKFWSEQRDMPNGVDPLIGVLNQFCDFYRMNECKTIWCKGLDFDIPIIKHALNQCAIEVPWKYNDVRDFRTLKKCFALPEDAMWVNGNKHNALADAHHQASELLLMAQTYDIPLK